MKKKTICVLMALSVLWLGLSGFIMPPSLSPGLQASGDPPPVTPNQTQTITFTLTNSGLAAARDIVLTPPENGAITGAIGDISGVVPVGALAPGQSVTVEVPIKAGTLAAGPYAFEMTLSYAYTGYEYDASAPQNPPKPVNEKREEKLTLMLDVLSSAEMPPLFGGAWLSNGTIAPGETVLLEAVFDTAGMSIASLSLGGPAIGYTGFSLVDETLLSLENAPARRVVVDGTKVRVNFALKASDGFEGGVKTFHLTVSGPEGSNQTQLVTTDIRVASPAKPGDQTKKLVITAIRQGSQKPDANRLVHFEVDVANTGAVPLASVALSIGGLSQTLGLPAGTIIPEIETLAPGESRTIAFSLRVDASLQTGATMLDFTLSAAGSELVKAEYACIIQQSTAKPDPSPTPPPKVHLMLSDYEVVTEDGTIRAGSPFTLRAKLHNTSTTQWVGSIKIRATSKDGILLPEAASHSLFIERIAAGGTADFELPMTAAIQASTRSYSLSLLVTYVDASGQTHEDVDMPLSFPVVQPVRVSLGEMNLSTGTNGMPLPLNLHLINLGRIAAYNITARVEGPFALSGGESVFYGNLGAGANDYLEDMLIPLEEGKLEGTLVLDFEDVSGNAGEYRHEFVMHAAPGGDMPPGEPSEPFPMPGGEDNWPGKDPGEPADATPATFPWLPVILPLVALALAGTALVIVKKRRQAAASAPSTQQRSDS